MKNNLLEHYKELTKFLSLVLGQHYEIILYWIDQSEVSIAAIENNHISGRTIDSPITEFGISLIQNKTYTNQDYITHFKSVNRHNVHLTSSTFFIKDDDSELIGMLGINHDNSADLNILEKLDEIKQIIQPNVDEVEKTQSTMTQTNWSPQILSNNIEEIIFSVISPDLLQADVSLSQDLKVNIVRTLNQRGIFTMKGAVTTVANILQISEPSVYRYLKMVENEG